MTKPYEVNSPFREGEPFEVSHGRTLGKNYIEGSSNLIAKDIPGLTWKYYEKTLLPFIKDIQTRLSQYLPHFDLVVTGTDKKHKISVSYAQEIVDGFSLENEIVGPALALLKQLDDLLFKNAEMYLSQGHSLDLDPHNLFFGVTQNAPTPHLYVVDIGDPWTKEMVKESLERREGNPIIDEIETLTQPYLKYYEFPKAKQALELLKE